MPHRLPAFYSRERMMNVSHYEIKETYKCRFWLDGICQLLSKKCEAVCKFYEDKKDE